MGNALCCRGGFRRHDIAAVLSEPLDEGLGHSFCYVRPDVSLSKVHSEETTTTSTTFRTISGASVSANASTPLSTSFVDFYSYSSFDRAAAFESSNSFASIPLQPVPRLDGLNGLNERGFMSGPIERGFVSGPLYSGNLERFSSGGEENLSVSMNLKMKLQRSFSHGGFGFGLEKGGLIRGIRKAIARKVSRGGKSIVAPVKGMKEFDWMNGLEKSEMNRLNGLNGMNEMNGGCLSSEESLGMEDEDCLQWAQGKAGEDRVHVVISEENGLVFVGIYDGFNGPDAPDFLLSNLYPAVQKELKGLLWDDTPAPAPEETGTNEIDRSESRNEAAEGVEGVESVESDEVQCCSNYDESESYPKDLNLNSENCRGKKCKSRARGAAKKWEESQRRWKCEWDRERLELDQKLKEQSNDAAPKPATSINHGEVMKALSEALRKTEEAYLDITDMMATENPELALMGSCILVMLMKGEDVYVMNVGDSRAVLAQKAEPDFLIGHDLERISEDGDEVDGSPKLTSLQLTKDHCTSIVGEVQRIKNEHQDDACAVVNDRVKGSLKVTRAFGAGFLKQPKWNNALLEMFRIDYVGNCPYISCTPSLYHHKLSSKDKFLILSSDGLYEYFTNQEAVTEVELFIASSPEGDPAQHLIEEVLFRAAKKAGMDFHELLDIPQGDRRRYHDDVSVIVISLEGRIWRSCM